VLRQAGVPYAVIELNGETVRRARRQGEPVIYGDAARREVLEAAGLPAAGSAVFAISDPVAVRRAVAVARGLNPGLYLLVRTRRLHEVDELLRIGADEVIAEELETAIEIFTRVLARLGVALNVVEAETRVLRGDAYRMLRAPAAGWALSDKVAAALAQGTTTVFFLEADHAAAGRTLGEIDLRRATGATLLAAVRGERAITNPTADLVLQPGDSLVLMGSHAEVRAAMDALAGRT
jgi:CPA2 family monovalent cation:H+ antiporter-2